MEPCVLCGAEFMEECSVDCPNWDERFDEIFDFSSDYSRDEEEEVEVEWK